MLIRKTAGFFLAALLFAAAALGIFLPLPSRRADADTSPVSLTTENAELFLPESYEQYLALKDPTDVAVCEKYIAVADENSIYVFSRENGQYSVYTNGSSSSVKINKIQFSDSGDLYFVNSAMQFYKLNLVDMSVGKTPLYSLSNFFISGNLIYAATTTANETQLRILNLDGSDNVAEIVPLVDKLNATPHLFFENGILYYTIVDTVTAYTVATRESERFILKDNKSSTDLTPLTPSAICAYGDDIFFTNSRGLFRNNKSQNDLPPIDEDDDYSALTEYEGMLYAVKGKTIKQYDIEAGEFTDYEIAAASSSVNRLSGATECVRAGNLLVTADKGNDRISVYDTAEKSFVTLGCTGVNYVATDGTSIAAATENGIFIFEPVYVSESRSFVLKQTKEITQEYVVGVVCVYGTFYYVTSDYYYGKIERDDGTENGWTNSTEKRNVGITPKAIAADLFGDIFVVDQSGNVYELGEDDFAATGGLGNPVATIQGEFTSLRAGFDGTLYYLDENGKFCGVDGEIANIDGADFVYLGEGSRQPVSFALGFEDDEVYFCFGDFIVKSKAGELGLSLFGQLSDAKDIVREGNLLVVADTGNNRVTVYDMKKHSFTVIETDFSPTLVATDGSVIAAASGNKVYVCDYGDECFGKPTTADLGTIKGLACVNGTAYYITQYGYGKVEEEDKGLVSRLEDPLVALAADANGILYVVDTSGHVRYYYEDEFADPDVPSGGYTEFCLHTPISSLRADREGNLYYLSENALWKNDEKLTEFGSNSFGYGSASSPVAFALDFENNDVYLLYGDYIVKAKPEALGILTLTDIYDIYLQTLPISDDK